MAEKMANDFLVASIVRKYNICGKKIWFNELERVLDGRMARNTISRTIDKLFDYGLMSGNWECVDGSWKRTYDVSGEAEAIVDRIIREHGSKDDFLQKIFAQVEGFSAAGNEA